MDRSTTNGVRAAGGATGSGPGTIAGVGVGGAGRALAHDEIARICDAALLDWDVDGKRVLVLIPDGTRTCPLATMFGLVYERLAPRVRSLDFLVALGTHQPMSESAILARVGITSEQHARDFPRARFLNHAWNDPGALVEVGRLARRDVEEISEARLSLEVAIRINRAVVEHDRLLIVGPVFPHEVAGFSGGNKYLFPGVSGPEIIDFFHWLGALVTNRRIIGVRDTPVRRVLDRCAAMVPTERRALCMVVRPADGELAGLYHGSPEDAWRAAVELSARIHVAWHDREYHSVLSRCPPMYPDLWTGGKCMYKLEPVVADGGTLIVWAPHIREVSRVHGRVLERIGYHVRDYFVAQWSRFEHEPWGVLAHSTHVKGDGTWIGGVERARVRVELATSIPRALCESIGLGYRDPATIDVAEWTGREAEGVLYVPKAGETLHRVRGAS